MGIHGIGGSHNIPPSHHHVGDSGAQPPKVPSPLTQQNTQTWLMEVQSWYQRAQAQHPAKDSGFIMHQASLMLSKTTGSPTAQNLQNIVDFTRQVVISPTPHVQAVLSDMAKAYSTYSSSVGETGDLLETFSGRGNGFPPGSPYYVGDPTTYQTLNQLSARARNKGGQAGKQATSLINQAFQKIDNFYAGIPNKFSSQIDQLESYRSEDDSVFSKLENAFINYTLGGAGAPSKADLESQISSATYPTHDLSSFENDLKSLQASYMNTLVPELKSSIAEIEAILNG